MGIENVRVDEVNSVEINANASATVTFGAPIFGASGAREAAHFDAGQGHASAALYGETAHGDTSELATAVDLAGDSAGKCEASEFTVVNSASPAVASAIEPPFLMLPIQRLQLQKLQLQWMQPRGEQLRLELGRPAETSEAVVQRQ